MRSLCRPRPQQSMSPASWDRCGTDEPRMALAQLRRELQIPRCNSPPARLSPSENHAAKCSCFPRPGVFANRAHHPHMSEATAQDASECLAHILVTGGGVFVEHSFGGQNYAAQAEAALRGAFVDERLLNGMRLLGGAHAFECGEFGVPHRAHGHHAGTHDFAAHDHAAGAALRHSAPELRTAQAKLVGQHEQQWSSFIYLHRVDLAIHLEGDFAHDKSQFPTAMLRCAALLRDLLPHTPNLLPSLENLDTRDFDGDRDVFYSLNDRHS